MEWNGSTSSGRKRLSEYNRRQLRTYSTTATVYTSTTPRQGTAHNGASYICILSHTSGALTEPLIGANWATYWEVLAEKGADGLGAGDMLKATYDPTSINASAFNQDNMLDGVTNKNYTATEQSRLANTSGSNTGDQDLSTYTNQGNTFNGVSQLVQTDGTGKLPAIDGSLLTGIASVTINNTLTSTSTTEALSANMGKTLEDNKQANLVSGTNIKTVGGASILGAGDISAGGGVDTSTISVAVNTTMVSGSHYVVTVDTIIMTLPITPAFGSKVIVSVEDFYNTTIARNGSNIMGLGEDMKIDTNNTTVEMQYFNSTEGWRIV